jgi:hypothetical protein
LYFGDTYALHFIWGIPQANLDLFRSLNTDSVFVVTMNTGDVLQFTYLDTQQVGRANTAFFRQDTPGLVLVLIGETFADGSPTDLRYLVRANYPADQEIALLEANNQASIVPMGIAQNIGDVTLTVSDARLVSSANLPSDLAYALVDIQLVSGTNVVSPATWQWFLELSASERLTLDPNASAAGNCATVNTNIPPNTSTCLSLGFIVSRYIDSGRLLVGTSADNLTAFEVQFTPVPIELSANSLDVQLGRVSYTSDTLTVAARVFNPMAEPISISVSDMSLVLGFVPNPTGPAISPMFDTTIVELNSALNLNLDFSYGGEGYATLSLLGRIWAIEIR